MTSQRSDDENRNEQGDEGSILVLTLGYVVLLLGLCLVVTDASAVFLARRSLAAACDSASLAAAQSVDAPTVYRDGHAGKELPLAAVQRAVASFQQEGALSASVEDGTRVVVSGRRPVRLPVLSQFGIRPITVTARAAASSRELPE